VSRAIILLLALCLAITGCTQQPPSTGPALAPYIMDNGAPSTLSDEAPKVKDGVWTQTFYFLPDLVIVKLYWTPGMATWKVGHSFAPEKQ